MEACLGSGYVITGSNCYPHAGAKVGNTMPIGRPRIPYDAELADEICERFATEVKGLEAILADLKAERGDLPTPSLSVIYRWLDENEDFQQKSARARRLRADTLADIRLQYALEPMIGTTTTTMEWGEQVKVGDNVARSQLIVQTISKHIGQLAPAKYGEKVEHEHKGKLTLESLVIGSPEPSGAIADNSDEE